MTTTDNEPQFKRPLAPPDLRVRLAMFSPAEGGRSAPLWQGCRMPHDFGLPEEMNDGMYEFLTKPPQPGETAEGYLWLLDPERNACRLFPGFEYRAWEGKFVAKGIVIEVINKVLQSKGP